jgi:hypothetical protein
LFAHEGDNTGDAGIMASAAALLLDLNFQHTDGSTNGALGSSVPAVPDSNALLKVLRHWKVPPVWTKLFAPPPPRGLY